MLSRRTSARSIPAIKNSQTAGSFHGWEVALVLLAVVSLLLLTTARTVGANVWSSSGFFRRVVRPGMAFWGEPVDVELRLDARTLPSCAAPVDTKPVYVVLAIDHSGSMAGQPLIEARNAASDFSGLMNLTKEGDAVAIVMFNDVADLRNGFSHERSRVVRSIQGISEGGGTDIASGLALATQQFSAKGLESGVVRVIILLSDGQQEEPGDPIAAARAAKSLGLRVVTIALGDADRNTLAQIASSPDDYYETADPTALIEIYGEIAAGIVGSIATDVTLDEHFNDSRFELVDDSIFRTVRDSNHLTWNFPFVGGRGRSTGYTLRPTALGWHQITTTTGQVSLTDCSGQIRSQATPIGPRVLVLFPVWLLYIFPALALLWTIYRLFQRRPPPQTVDRPDIRRKPVAPVKPADKRRPNERGADVTHGRPRKH